VQEIVALEKPKKIVFGKLSVDPERMRSILVEQRTRLGLSHRALADLAGVAPTFNWTNS
jgi:hypothetical protein